MRGKGRRREGGLASGQHLAQVAPVDRRVVGRAAGNEQHVLASVGQPGDLRPHREQRGQRAGESIGLLADLAHHLRHAQTLSSRSRRD